MVLMLAGLPLNLAAKVFAGYQELHTYNKTLAVGAIGSVVGLIIGIWVRVSMPTLFLLSFGSNTLVATGTLLSLVLWHKPWLRPRLRLLSLHKALDLLSTGWSFLLIQAAAMVVFSTDNIIVSHYLGAAEVTPYSVTWRVVSLGSVLQALVFPALWPAYAEARARGEVAWIRRTFAIAMRTTIALNVAWAVFLVVFGQFGIRLWAGHAAVPQRSLLVAMAFWSVIAGFMTAQSCLLGALNRTRVQAVASALAAVVNVALSIVLVVRIGSLGVILGTIISYLIVLVVPQSFVVMNAIRNLERDSRASASAPEVISADVQPIA
jgi:O-antigen/teichoic acid export membrane protein